MKAYFESTRKKLRFQNRKTYSGSAPWTMGSILEKVRGSNAKITAKGYDLILALDLGLDGREVRQGTSLAGTVRPARRLPLTATQSSSASAKTVLETTGRQTRSTGRKRRELRTRLGILLGCGADRGSAVLGGATQ